MDIIEVRVNGWRILSLDIVNHLHLWLMQRSVLVKNKVGGLKRKLTIKLN